MYRWYQDNTSVTIDIIVPDGTLPTQLGSLTQLQTLELDHCPWITTNTISGTVPSEFGGFTQMQLLNLDQNCFSGTLPTAIGLLGNLKSLAVDTNHMRGPLPSEMGELWDLRKCQITGESPWLNYPENYFDCIVPESFPSVCNVDECHPPLSPPSPPLPPPSHGIG